MTQWRLVKREPVVHEFIGLAAFLPLLINADGDGLSFKDGMALDRFCERNDYTLDKGHFSYEEDCETFFARCEVTGVQGVCTNIHYVEMYEKEKAS